MLARRTPSRLLATSCFELELLDLRMNYAEPKMPLERIEVPVPMQQRVVMTDTVRRDQAVNRFPHGRAATSQGSVVLRCGDRKVRAARIEDGKLGQLPGYSRE